MEVALVLGIINTVISMIACPIIASYKGLSVGGCIFGGLFLGLLGLIIVSCLKKLINKCNTFWGKIYSI